MKPGCPKWKKKLISSLRPLQQEAAQARDPISREIFKEYRIEHTHP